MTSLKFEDPTGKRQAIDITCYPDRIIAVCNGATAIFPLYNKADQAYKPAERDLDALAEEIYYLVYSGDNKYHRANITNEIADWLKNGDQGAGRTAAELAKEWIEYDQEPEKETD